MKQVYLQPGNKLVYEIEFEDPYSERVKVIRIDKEDEGEFWNKVPASQVDKPSKELCFRNYIPPQVSIDTPDNIFCKTQTYLFGCQIDRNKLQKNSKY